jgi:NADH:ubiquinone oxidoreductase subunit H
VRSVAQTISYEVTMALILVLIIFTSLSFDFVGISFSQSFLWYFFLFSPIFGM